MNKKIILFLITLISGLFLIAGINSTQLETQAKNEKIVEILRFAHLSDIHIDSKAQDNSKRLYADSSKLFQDAINQINNVKDIDLVLFSGDSINRPSEPDLIRFISIANKLDFPWLASTGNHEIGISGGLTKARRIDILNKYNKNIDTEKSYYSFCPKKGYLIVVMDGVINTRVSANGYYPNNELDWLDKKLAENKNSKVIIIQHFPVVEPYRSESHYILNSQEYKNILNKHNNVIAVLSGHYHATKIHKYKNIAHISTPALVEYPNAFRIITVQEKDGKIQLKSEFKETRLKYLQQKSKSRSNSWKLNQGNESDRDTIINLDKQ